MGNKKREIGGIYNYYAYLTVKQNSNKYYWAIEGYDGPYWEQIPKSLYDELMKFEDNRKGEAESEKDN